MTALSSAESGIPGMAGLITNWTFPRGVEVAVAVGTEVEVGVGVKVAVGEVVAVGREVAVGTTTMLRSHRSEASNSFQPFALNCAGAPSAQNAPTRRAGAMRPPYMAALVVYEITAP